MLTHEVMLPRHCTSSRARTYGHTRTHSHAQAHTRNCTGTYALTHTSWGREMCEHMRACVACTHEF
eukprot:5753566-Pleurochrysis_carterae.AAC.1